MSFYQSLDGSPIQYIFDTISIPIILLFFLVTLCNQAVQAIQIQRVSIASSQSQKSIDFEVLNNVGSGESRIIFASLRCNVPLASIKLFDPQQRLVWHKTPTQLGFTPKHSSQYSELGDAITLPELYFPIAGRWRLQLERSRPYNREGLVLFSFHQLPRYELSLTALESSLHVGQIQNYVLRPTDFGTSVLGLGSLALDLKDSNGKKIQVPAAQEKMRTPNGILISDEPGTYISRFALPAAGVYRLRARHVFNVRQVAEAQLNLEANIENIPMITPLHLKQVSYKLQDGCLQSATFEIEVNLSKSGFYAVTMLLVSGSNSRQLNRSTQLSAGRNSLKILVPASTLHELSSSKIIISRLGLIRFEDNKVIPIAEILDLKLSSEENVKLQSIRCLDK